MQKPPVVFLPRIGFATSHRRIFSKLFFFRWFQRRVFFFFSAPPLHGPPGSSFLLEPKKNAVFSPLFFETTKSGRKRFGEREREREKKTSKTISVSGSYWIQAVWNENENDIQRKSGRKNRHH